ncbi:hypothetical protein [Synechococcus sp. CCAP 1479/9]|uniref:hypothetical protein n=1 Tax=Synechococcus sp. CCAP 1479/9 TaxID=1221593 RepID=UPI001C24C945|nr:hypothetical protein [Synechococcus sp. CCAP 1479/9]
MPIAAKLLDGVEDVVTVTILGHAFPLHLQLPFSWKVLFFASLAFLIANILFMAFCPALVKQTDTYRDYASQRRGGSELSSELQQLGKSQLVSETEMAPWISWLNLRETLVANPTQRRPESFSSNDDDRAFVEIYTLVAERVALRSFVARYACAQFYSLGLAGIAVVLVQNVIFVLKHL